MVFIFGTMISYDMCMTRHASEHRYDIGVKVKVKVLKMCLSARNTHASFTLRWGGGGGGIDLGQYLLMVCTCT